MSSSKPTERLLTHRLDRPSRRIRHDLAPHFDALRSFPTRRALYRSDFYRQHGAQLEEAVAAVEWDNTLTAGPTDAARLRVVAWNIERGKRLEGILDALQAHPHLRHADLVLLTEADIGMGRSHNRNIPRRIAAALGLNYAFASAFFELTKGDASEQDHDRPNTLALHGNAVLSRFPITGLRTVWLPRYWDYYRTSEKRLGGRRSLVCTLDVGGRPLHAAVAHLDFNSSPRQRGLQLAATLDAFPNDTAPRLIGGDWNTSTYNLATKAGLLYNLLYKFICLGFDGTVQHYMTPERLFERPLFNQLERYGFSHAPFNNRSKGTFHYDVNDPVTAAKTRQFLPAPVLRWFRRRLEKWNGCVPLRLDWLAGQGLEPIAQKDGDALPPRTVTGLRWQNTPVSDHDPIALDLRLPLLT